MPRRESNLRVNGVRPRVDTPAYRQNPRGDTVSYLLTVAFVLSLFLVGLVVVLILFGWGEAAGLVVLTMLVVLLALGALFVISGNEARR